MKENFFKNLKNNVKNALTFQDEDDYYDEDGYVDEEEEEPVDEPLTPPAPKASPKAATKSAPGYQPYGAQSPYQAAAYQPYGAAQPDQTAAKGKKSSGNIYSMNDVKATQKLKVALFVLEDMDDARNVADCMIDRGIVTICDMSKISVAEERRVLDFLDGVKYVCNSKIENISEHIYLIVPEAAELSGDFFSQVDSTSFYG